ncbi:MAG: AraC family transcriptional regulator [Holophagales bacterium]|nr:AraC family transcriptional regulator [Holophagales bacterium]
MGPRDIETAGRFQSLLAARAVASGEDRTPWPRLKLYRIEEPMPSDCVLYTACLCMVARGEKRVTIGEETYVYDPFNYLVVPVSLPVYGEIPEASPEQPYLGLVLDLDGPTLSELVLDLEDLPGPSRSLPEAAYVSRSDGDLLGAVVRLLEALDDPAERRVLAPAAEREILFRLLTGPGGHHLRQFAMSDSAGYRVIQAVRYLQENFERPIEVAELAGEVNMSASAFHHTFKRVTSYSPIQYLKRIRLLRARTSMLQEGLGVGEAAFRVGYGSPSQFSREYRRQFGAPPSQDIERFREG